LSADPCPPSCVDNNLRHLSTQGDTGLQSGFDRDDSFQTDDTELYRSSLSLGYSRVGIRNELDKGLNQLDTKLDLNMDAIKRAILDLEDASIQKVQTAAQTCQNLLEVAENLKRTVEELRDLKRKFSPTRLVLGKTDRKHSRQQQPHQSPSAENAKDTFNASISSTAEQIPHAPTATSPKSAATALPREEHHPKVQQSNSVLTLSTENVKLVGFTSATGSSAPRVVVAHHTMERTDEKKRTLSSSSKGDVVVVPSSSSPSSLSESSATVARVIQPHSDEEEVSEGRMVASTGFVDLQRSIGDVGNIDGRYERQLKTLAEMGWSSKKDLVFKKILLKLHNGDINKVVKDLRDYQRVGSRD